MQTTNDLELLKHINENTQKVEEFLDPLSIGGLVLFGGIVLVKAIRQITKFVNSRNNSGNDAIELFFGRIDDQRAQLEKLKFRTGKYLNERNIAANSDRVDGADSVGEFIGLFVNTASMLVLLAMDTILSDTEFPINKLKSTTTIDQLLRININNSRIESALQIASDIFDNWNRIFGFIETDIISISFPHATYLKDLERSFKTLVSLHIKRKRPGNMNAQVFKTLTKIRK